MQLQGSAQPHRGLQTPCAKLQAPLAGSPELCHDRRHTSVLRMVFLQMQVCSRDPEQMQSDLQECMWRPHRGCSS